MTELTILAGAPWNTSEGGIGGLFLRFLDCIYYCFLAGLSDLSVLLECLSEKIELKF